AYERAKGLAARSQGKVFKATLTPHWFDNGTRFWYRNDLKGGTKEFILVDAEKGMRGSAFDHQKLADALSKAADKAFAADKLPFESIELVDGVKSVRFKTAGATWDCNLTSYECVKSAKEMEDEEPTTVVEPESSEVSEANPWDGELDDAAPDAAVQQKKKG